MLIVVRQDAAVALHKKAAATVDLLQKDVHGLRAQLAQEETDNALLLEELDGLQRTLTDVHKDLARLKSGKASAEAEAARLADELAALRRSGEAALIQAANDVEVTETYANDDICAMPPIQR